MGDQNLDEPDATPIHICADAVGRIAIFWDDVTSRTGKGKGLFISEIFSQIWQEGSSGESFEAELEKWEEKPTEIQPLGILQAALACCAYACQGIKAEIGGDVVAAWKFTTLSKYWLGIVVGSWSIRKDQDAALKKFSMSGVNARHAENRAMKQQVLEWLDNNMDKFRSYDAAAEEISRNVVPVKFRTARDWVAEWKKLRSPGKA